MKKIQYNIHNFILQVSAPEEIDLHKLQSQIPGIEYSLSNNKTPDTEFVFIERKNCKIIQSKNKFTLYGAWSEGLKTDIPHLFYAILRQYWIEKGYYPIHSILLENSLVLGHSGSGKTSLSIEAMKHNMQISSYDKTLVHFSAHEMNCIAGTNIISLRKDIYENNFSQTSDLNHFDRPIHYGDRVLFFSKNKIVKTIKNIYLFFISETPLAIKPMSIDSSLHELYPYFMDTIKTDIIVGNGQAIFSGNNSSKSKTVLMNHLKNWLQCNESVEILVGKKEDIVQYIKNNNQRKFA